MSRENYTLEIVSHHKQFANKSLRKYLVDGIETVGAFGDEPFEIRFKNNTYEKVQVKLSLDGTDILSGKPADTEVSKDMWVVNGMGTLSLKAWPESSKGGASFVFTSADNSVAAHTHGDMSCRGIIAAAVFVEGYVEPYRINDCRKGGDDRFDYFSTRNYTKSIQNNAGGPTGAGHMKRSRSNTYHYDIMEANSSLDASPAATEDIKSLVSIGAGQYVNQKISYVTGLIKPTLSETVKIKYFWWDDLKEKLRTETEAKAQPSGFPGDKEHKHIDLKGTPRIGDKKGSFQRVESVTFSRV